MFDEDTDISESELEEYADSCYEKLKHGNPTLKVSENEYKCPCCPGKPRQVFLFNDLLQHASGVSQGSQKTGTKYMGRHLGLVKYLKDLNEYNSSPEFMVVTDEASGSNNVDEVYVWPWMGVVANIPVQWKDERYVEESGSELRDELINKGFNPIKIHPLWDYKGHLGYAIVEFRDDWLGFSDAIRFEKAMKQIIKERGIMLGLEKREIRCIIGLPGRMITTQKMSLGIPCARMEI